MRNIQTNKTRNKIKGILFPEITMLKKIPTNAITRAKKS